MSLPTRLEAYLAELDRALNGVALSERADIVTEIKSHVLEAQEREPQRSLESILGALGEPEQVANRYLMERGLKPSKPPRRPIAQWLVAGFLGTLSLGMLTFLILIWKFTPLIEVDEEKGRVVILGGLIDVQEKPGRAKIRVGNHAWAFDDGGVRVFEGSKKLPAGGTIQVPFNNGDIELSNASGDQFAWECKVKGTDTASDVREKGGKTVVDVSKTSGVKCELKVPANAKVEVNGSNGKVEVDEPRYHLDVKLANGKVSLTPDPNQNYKYTTSLTLGKMDTFVSSEAKDALKISVNVTNGVIEHD